MTTEVTLPSKNKLCFVLWGVFENILMMRTSVSHTFFFSSITVFDMDESVYLYALMRGQHVLPLPSH